MLVRKLIVAGFILLPCLALCQSPPAEHTVDKVVVEHGVSGAEQALKTYRRTLGKYANLSSVAANSQSDAQPIVEAGRGILLIRRRLSGAYSVVDPDEVSTLADDLDAVAGEATLAADRLRDAARSGKDRARKLEAANTLAANVRQLKQSSAELRKIVEAFIPGAAPRRVVAAPGGATIQSGEGFSGGTSVCPALGCNPLKPPVIRGSFAVTISPGSASLLAGGSQQFNATVSGTNPGVTWSATAGTITPGGLFTAPANGGSYTVTATSMTYPDVSGSAAINVSPSASGSVFLGNPNVEAQTGSIAAGQAEAFQATAGGSGNLQTLAVYLDATSTVTQMTAGLYTDAGGHPGALLAQGSSAQLQAGGWNSVLLPPTALVAGTPYWVAVLGTAGGTLAFRNSSGACAAETSGAASLSALPAAWTTGAASPACPASVFGDSTKVVFYDTFAGTTISPYWTVISRHGEYAQSETECNIPQQVVVNNGLTITTAAQNWSCGDFNITGTVRHAAETWPYITGDIQWTNLNFTYGTVEIRGQFPGQNTGLWPAFWLLGMNCQVTNIFTADVGYSTCPRLSSSKYAEIDMVECDLNNWCQLALSNPNTFPTCGFAVDTSVHTFTLVWNATSVAVAMDGMDTGCSYTSNTMVIPSTPMFLIIQTQTGGAGGDPNSALLPASLQVQYVKVMQP